MTAPGTAPGQRDLRAEVVHREFTGWIDAQSWPLISGPEVYTLDEMAMAFAAGMQAQRDLAAAAPAPRADDGCPIEAVLPDGHHPCKLRRGHDGSHEFADEGSWEPAPQAELIRQLRAALAEAAGHVEPAGQNSELVIAGWLELAGRETDHTGQFAQPQAAPEAISPEPIIVSPGDGSAIGSLLAHVLPIPEIEQPQAAPELAPCPGCESLRRQHAETCGEVGILAAALREIQGAYAAGTYAHDLAHTTLDRLHGLLPEAKAAPELAAAMRETRDLCELAAEIISAFGPSGFGHTARVGQVQIRKWRERAGLEGQ